MISTRPSCASLPECPASAAHVGSRHRSPSRRSLSLVRSQMYGLGFGQLAAPLRVPPARRQPGWKSTSRPSSSWRLLANSTSSSNSVSQDWRSACPSCGEYHRFPAEALSNLLTDAREHKVVSRAGLHSLLALARARLNNLRPHRGPPPPSALARLRRCRAGTGERY